MRKALIILIIIVWSVSSSAGIKEDYEKQKQEQKYRFLHRIREVKQQGRIDLIRAKNNQKVRRRYSYHKRLNYGRMYSNRQCR